MPILKTRLYKPVLKPNYVTRKKILDYLDINADNSLTMVVAPAGYGKSVTISQWLDRKLVKYGWISLDGDCNDLRIFLDYLVTGIQLFYPSSLSNIKELCNLIDLPSVKVISELLLNELSNLDDVFALVLDDYHLINNLQLHELINEILKYCPEKLRLFIISRRDPPLKLSSLRAYDRINDIRMAELSFDINEVIDLSVRISAKPINFQFARELVDLADGWIVGIRLAFQSMEQGHDLKLVNSYKGNEMHEITMFMVDEILQPLTPFIREFFYKASILSSFCKDLLLEICLSEETKGYTSQDTGNVTFDEVTTNNLFIIPLDSDRVWFRFHHLFGEILKKQLEERYGPDQISALHRKASRWLERNGFSDEALKHALSAGDMDFVNQIIDNKLNELFDNEEFSTMHRWLGMLPQEGIDNYLAPKLIHSYLCDLNHDYVNMEQALDITFKILKSLSTESHNNIRWGYYYSLQSILFYKTERISECLLSSNHALELLETENSYLRDAALLYHAFALIAAGNCLEAENKVMHYRTLIQSNDQLGLSRNSVVISYVSFLTGNLTQIHKSLYPVFNFYKGKIYHSTREMAYYYLGFVNYQWNHLDEVISEFNEIWEYRFSGMPRWILNHLFVKLLALKAKGEKTALKDLLDKAHKYIGELSLPVWDKFLACMEVEIALIENDFDRVEQFRHIADYDNPMPYCFYFVPQFTLVKLNLKEGGTENFRKAHTELSRQIEYLQRTSNITLLIQALTLQAVLLKLMSNIQDALANLSKAIILAKPGGFIRVFVDMGEEIRDLIRLLKKEKENDPYLNQILEAFSNEQLLRIFESNHRNITGRNFYKLGMESLSAKEIEILKLAALGLQNKEIGDKLFLSPNSIKKYLYYIFKKLEVKNRANAIEKAKQMNLFN